MKCPFDKGLVGRWPLGPEIISFFTRCVISHRHPVLGPDSGPTAWHPVQKAVFGSSLLTLRVCRSMYA
jgi:hypothetical protein